MEKVKKMKTQIFNTIQNKLNKIIKDKEDFILNIKKKPKISTWTIEELQNSLKEARRIQSECDKFLTADLYHILGMGKLTVTQTNKILKFTRDLSRDRSVLKAVSYLAADNTFEFNIKDFEKDISKPTYKSSLFNITLSLD